MENRAEFIERNVGLVRSLVPRFLGRGIEYDDLFQAGCVGLMKAAEHFDPDRGFKFSTYAVPVILGEMRRLFRDGGAVKVSRSLKELSMKAVRLSEKIEMETGEAPSISELAAQLGVTPERCAEALNAAVQPLSLTNDEDSGETDVPVDSPEEKIADRLALQQVIKTLPDADQRLLEYRYFGNQTQVETAKRLGISQVQVSRREKKLLLYLRSLLL
ncbi:sigma-70 family RNA polymerase sigma factor [Anaeromassilibacillus senegalensis]|uniref:Sigma-70 family RNA polymerase sigma factor n=1 Tax=Anaeromassilibacillus senegalensis TaxID=1673717 RepID=A0ABS9CPB1_9FIRM|nr:sigma-70 family RNA polymerase sigma factor [Anaeromassilibacillus senegalensis]MCF2652216.1 sigma-70 family RNA polymerase sigma factor [Anaeromassilibacillus senegalensis]